MVQIPDGHRTEMGHEGDRSPECSISVSGCQAKVVSGALQAAISVIADQQIQLAVVVEVLDDELCGTERGRVCEGRRRKPPVPAPKKTLSSLVVVLLPEAP